MPAMKASDCEGVARGNTVGLANDGKTDNRDKLAAWAKKQTGKVTVIFPAGTYLFTKGNHFDGRVEGIELRAAKGADVTTQVLQLSGNGLESLIGEDDEARAADGHVAQRLLHCLRKVADVDRFSDVTIGLQAAGLHLDLVATVGGDEDGARLWAGCPYPADQFQPADARHAQISDQQVHAGVVEHL